MNVPIPIATDPAIVSM